MPYVIFDKDGTTAENEKWALSANLQGTPILNVTEASGTVVRYVTIADGQGLSYEISEGGVLTIQPGVSGLSETIYSPAGWIKCVLTWGN